MRGLAELHWVRERHKVVRNGDKRVNNVPGINEAQIWI